MQSGASAIADRRSGQRSLFAQLDDDAQQAIPVKLPDLPEFSERELAQLEKEVLGFYLSSHPLEEYQATFRTYCTHTSTELAALPDRAEVFLGGMLSAIKFAHVKNARPGSPSKYANFDLEDVDGMTRCILWPDDFVTYGHLVQADGILVLRGVIDRRGGGDEVNLIVNELIPLDELSSRYTSGIVVRIDENQSGARNLASVREIVRGYPGNCELQLLLMLADGTSVHLRSTGTRLEVNSELRSRLASAVGAGNIRMITSRPNGTASNRRSRRPAESPVA
jgi:DNA polymerase-3 subunit alpha